MNRKELWAAASVAMEEGAAFASMDQAVSWILDVEREAKRLHRVYVRQCNGYSPREYAYPKRAEASDNRKADNSLGYLRETFKDHGLRLYLNTDPRGNPVGIHTPKSGRYNTMGGAECGWRL